MAERSAIINRPAALPSLGVLTCLGALSLFMSGMVYAAAGEKPVLQALSWLAPEGRIEALTTEPEADFTFPDIPQADKSNRDPAQISPVDNAVASRSAEGEEIRAWQDSYGTGITLFNTPGLLGGQAAKAGLSCGSCHVNGRDNPFFQFPGISGAPGTADVSHSFFSAKRGNGSFDPVKIPDLAQKGKISHDPKSRDLEKFIRNLIVEEFGGDEPADYALDALSLYIRNLAATPANITDYKRGPTVLEYDLLAVEDGVAAAHASIERNDPAMAVLLLSGARHKLGLINERFAGADLDDQVSIIIEQSRKLGLIQRSIEAGGVGISFKMESWNKKFRKQFSALTEKSAQSLYNPIVLRQALAIPPKPALAP